MFVKICGITRLEDAQAAVEHGADAVGFILWPGSPRAISVHAARGIADQLPPETRRVGVFVNQPAVEVNAAADAAGLTHVQLHGDERVDYAARIRRPLIVLHAFEKLDRDPGPDGSREEWPAETMWLVDAHDPNRRGGTGRLADWDAAAALARTRRVLLAGGLTPENVAEAIERVRPFGIDVSSGVEARPGIKDPGRIAALFAAIAAAKLDERT